ncbi:MAG: universal stress protein [Flavobacteriaceae bacterium]|nr:universal stress protein [Flavobacteriaceae bacterium]
MKLLEKILMPIDVNTDYKEQLNTAIKIARSYNSEIIVIYVLSEEIVHNDIKEIVTNAIYESLNKVKETFKKERIIAREPVVEYGKPIDKILQIAIEENVNLILAGSGSKGKNEKFKLGINADKLIRLSDKPVWVVKSNEKTKLTNILCPVDFSEPSSRALKNAILLSRKFKASLRILGVYEPFANTSPRLKIDQEKENAYRLNQIEKEMNQFIKRFDLNGIDYKTDIQAGVASETILLTIKEYGHDLLVMGTNGRSGLNRLIMGSITEKVTREMPCSFVTTKIQDIIQLRFDNEIKEIEVHFKNANDLVKSGFYKEAISQYIICLQINDMHIPSMYKLAEVHRIIGDNVNAVYYDNMAKDLLSRLWDKKIEHEIRKHYRSGK